MMTKGEVFSVEEIKKQTWIKPQKIKEIIQIFIKNKIIYGKLERDIFIPSI